MPDPEEAPFKEFGDSRSWSELADSLATLTAQATAAEALVCSADQALQKALAGASEVWPASSGAGGGGRSGILFQSSRTSEVLF